MKEETKRPLRGRIIRRLVKYALWLIVAVAFFGAAILVTIQTRPGKRLLARTLTRLASGPGTTISFRGISGFLPFRAGLGELRLGDPEGDWMVIENVRVRLDPLDLLSLRLHAKTVAVERIAWHRIPAGEEDRAGKAGAGFTPAELPSFTIDRLRVDKITAGRALFGRILEASLEGSVSNDGVTGPRAELNLEPLRRPGEGLAISADAAPDLSRLRIDLALEEEAGGTLGGLVFPEDPGPLSIEFRAGGLRQELKTVFALSSPGRFEVAGNLVADLDLLLAEGELTAGIERPPFPDWGGAGDLSVRLAAEDGGQKVSLRLRGRDLAGAGILAKRVLIEAELADLFRAARGEISLEADELATPRRGEYGPDRGELIRRLTGRLVLRDDNRSPRADLDLHLLGYTLPGLVLAPGETRELNLAGRLTEDRLVLNLEGTGEGDFRLDGELEAAARFSNAPPALSLPEDGELRGALSLEIPLGVFNNLLALTRQTVGGRAEAEIELGGTWKQPSPRGEIVLSRGEYQNLVTGTVLHQLAARVKIEDDRLVLEEFSARTQRPPRPVLFSWTRFIPGIQYTPLVDRTREIPEEGRIYLSGWTRLSPSEGYPSSYSLRFENALLANIEIVTAIASGEIALEGSLEESRLAGTVRLQSVEGNIPTRVGATVPEIEVIEINKPGEEDIRPPPRPATFLENMVLDLRLTASHNVVVKGRGLDSEWEADISVRGTAAEPRIRGGLNLLDGIFLFMGEEMRLLDSAVVMDGEYPPAPQLRVNARIVKSDIIMNLQVIGPITRPEVLISSQPPYPDDEILARILFGRPVSQLSGLQALQIANGLMIIQGQVGFFELLTSWTTILGNIQVDFTDLDGADDHTAVRVRWSLSRNFYIENQRSIDSPDNLFLARWEIIRNLQLRVQSGYGMLGDAAFLHWRMDY